MNVLDLIWLIPMLPLAGAMIMLLAGRRLDPQPRLSPDAAAPDLEGSVSASHSSHGLRNLVSFLCPGMVLASFLLSAAAVWQLTRTEGRVHEIVLFRWLPGLAMRLGSGELGKFSLDFGFLLDPLSSVMILVVTGIGFLIHVYSVGYMGHERGYYRFFAWLNLFVFFMLMLVLANNYGLMFAGWEGVGLCSYLLIGFYFHKHSAANAAKKAFIVNRVGDAGFLVGLFILLHVFGTLQFTRISFLTANNHFVVETGLGVLSAATLLLFLGACGKSAQFPLHVWLPDAMEGPTPVSALIHAATMVTAGVYLVARSSALFQLTPVTSGVVLAVGGFTALMAATTAIVQTDIKRVLAWSTVSQLGFMFMACGAGAYVAAIFHLFTHAFFKALLFLGSGSVIHAMSGEQDMRRMGGLRTKLPVTFATMAIGALAISGVPGLAGFFSKDEILWQVFSSPLGSRAVYVVGLSTSFLTAFYMWRLIFLTFLGEPRGDAHAHAHAHESPRVMALPLILLAVASAAVGWLGVPKAWSFLPDGFRTFEHWLAPAVAALPAAEGGEHHSLSQELLLMGLSVLVAFAGIGLARILYRRAWTVEPMEMLPAPLHRFLLHQWYIDHFYNRVLVHWGAMGSARLMALFDHRAVDGAVNGTGTLTRLSAIVSGWLDRWVIDGAIRFGSALVRAASFPARAIQSGYVSQYALVILASVAAFLGWRLLQ